MRDILSIGKRLPIQRKLSSSKKATNPLNKKKYRPSSHAQLWEEGVKAASPQNRSDLVSGTMTLLFSFFSDFSGLNISDSILSLLLSY